MNWLLIAVLLILVVCAFAGWRMGFVKTVFSLVSTIVVIVVTLLVSPIVTKALHANDTVYDAIYGKMEQIIDLSGEDREGGTESIIDGLPVPEALKDVLRGSEELQETDGEGALEAYLCGLITEVILKAVGFIVTFVVTAAAIAVLCFLLNVISRLPVLHQINTLAGVAAGVLEGLIIVWIFFIALTMFGSTAFGQQALALISESPFLSFLYNNNLLSGRIF